MPTEFRVKDETDPHSPNCTAEEGLRCVRLPAILRSHTLGTAGGEEKQTKESPPAV